MKKLSLFFLFYLLLPSPLLAQTTAPMTPQASATISATTSSSRVAIPSTGATVEIQNTSTTVTVFIKFGTSSVTATTSDIPIPPARSVAYSRGNNTYIAGITASGSATLYVTSGSGIPYGSRMSNAILASLSGGCNGTIDLSSGCAMPTLGGL